MQRGHRFCSDSDFIFVSNQAIHEQVRVLIGSTRSVEQWQPPSKMIWNAAVLITELKKIYICDNRTQVC